MCTLVRGSSRPVSGTSAAATSSAQLDAISKVAVGISVRLEDFLYVRSLFEEDFGTAFFALETQSGNVPDRFAAFSTSVHVSSLPIHSTLPDSGIVCTGCELVATTAALPDSGRDPGHIFMMTFRALVFYLLLSFNGFYPVAYNDSVPYAEPSGCTCFICSF